MLQRTAPLPTRQERLLNATKLHEILRIALDDLKVVEKDPRYVVDMNVWHDMRSGVCYACLAGSTLAVSLKLPIHTTANPWNEVPEGMMKIMFVANALRRGQVDLALQYLTEGLDYDPYTDDLCDMADDFPSYGDPAWWPAMERMWLDLVAKDM